MFLSPICITAQKVIQRNFLGVEIGAKMQESEKIISNNLNIVDKNKNEIFVKDVYFGGYLWNACWFVYYCDIFYEITFMRNVEEYSLNAEYENLKNKLDLAYEGKDIYIKEEADNNGYPVYKFADESGMMIILSVSTQKGRDCIRLDYTNMLIEAMKYKKGVDEL